MTTTSDPGKDAALRGRATVYFGWLSLTSNAALLLLLIKSTLLNATPVGELFTTLNAITGSVVFVFIAFFGQPFLDKFRTKGKFDVSKTVRWIFFARTGTFRHWAFTASGLFALWMVATLSHVPPADTVERVEGRLGRLQHGLKPLHVSGRQGYDGDPDSHYLVHMRVGRLNASDGLTLRLSLSPHGVGWWYGRLFVEPDVQVDAVHPRESEDHLSTELDIRGNGAFMGASDVKLSLWFEQDDPPDDDAAVSARLIYSGQEKTNDPQE